MVFLFAFPLWFPHRWAGGWLQTSGRAWPGRAWHGGTGLQFCWDVMGDVDQWEVKECGDEADTKQDRTSLGVTRAVPSSVSMNAISPTVHPSSAHFFKLFFLCSNPDAEGDQAHKPN